MIDNQQVTVADGVGTIFCLALAVTIAGVAGNTAVTDPGGTESLTGWYIESVEMLEEVFTCVEVFLHGLCGRCDGRVACLLRRSQLTARVPFLGGKHVVSLAKGTLLWCQLTDSAWRVVVRACRQ